jgi:hypothetical protein
MSGLLPEGFAELEPFAAHWAGETASARAHLRDSASFAEAEAFYAAAQPLVEPGLACLDAKALKDHDDREQRLMRLILAFAHVAMAIEMQGKDEHVHSKLREHMRITRAPADFEHGYRTVAVERS